MAANRSDRHGIAWTAALACVLCACGSDDDAVEPSDGNPFSNASGTGASANAGRPSAGSSSASRSGSGGSSSGAAGSSSGGGDAGADREDAGAPDAGGTQSGGSGGGGPMGTQPLGKLCAFDSHCNQDMGEAVCCGQTCTVVQDCPESPLYLPCMNGDDCQEFGGKVCCEAGPERFCTKPSGCSGRMIP